jgi:hypothetical protein
VTLVVAMFVAVALVVDPRDMGERLAVEASKLLGEPVSIGEVGLSLFPAPSVTVQQVQVGSADARLLDAPEVQLRISLLAALAGQIVLTEVRVVNPRVRLEIDSAGRLVLPKGLASGRPASGGAEPQLPEGLAIAIHEFRVLGGQISVGEWEIQGLEVHGSLGLDLAIEVDIDADLPGIGGVRELRVRLDELGSDAVRVVVDGRFEALDLRELAARAGAEIDVAGSVGGTFGADLSGDRVLAVRLDLLTSGLRLASGELLIEGDVPLTVRAGAEGRERWDLDLAGTRIHGGAVAKPVGAPLGLSGDVGSDLTPDSHLTDTVLRIASQEVPLRISRREGSFGVAIDAAVLELDAFADWIDTEALGAPGGVSGRIAIEKFGVQFAPLELAGGLALEQVELGLPHGRVSISGPVQAKGTTLSMEDAAVVIGEQQFVISGAYDLGAGELDLRLGAASAEVDPIVRVLRGQSELSGTLALQLHVTGPPDLAAIEGSGSFEILDGEIRGFSIVEQVMGEFAKIPVLLAIARGHDLSKFDEERFERMAASFRISRGVLYADSLVVVYRSGTAELNGAIRLADGALDLRGTVVLSKEADEELGAQAGAPRTVIPIEGISGTVSAPRIRLSRAVLAKLASRAAASSPIGRSFERAIGKEASQAVQGLLERILGGRQRSQ